MNAAASVVPEARNPLGHGGCGVAVPEQAITNGPQRRETQRPLLAITHGPQSREQPEERGEQMLPPKGPLREYGQRCFAEHRDVGSVTRTNSLPGRRHLDIAAERHAGARNRPLLTSSTTATLNPDSRLKSRRYRRGPQGEACSGRLTSPLPIWCLICRKSVT